VHVRSPTKLLAPLAVLLLGAPSCGGGAGQSNPVTFRPRVAAIPHTAYDPAWADPIAGNAVYATWVDLPNEHTLDLAVWPSRHAARHALARYRAGGRDTRPRAERGWAHTLRRVERIRNVTLAWYHVPTRADKTAVMSSLQFARGTRGSRRYTALWLLPGTAIDPDATAATAPARYSARLAGGPIGGPIAVAIWSTEPAAQRHFDDLKSVIGGGFYVVRIRNATIEAQDWEARLTHADEAAVRAALH
jgi:hypothetical protein